MALFDSIRALRDRALGEMDAAHDYYVDTRFAWRFVRNAIQGGDRFLFRNKATGTLTSQSDLARKVKRYVDEQLTVATFQQFIAIFESFFFDLLRLWLSTYPQNLIGRKVDFKVILDSPDKEAVVASAVDKELTEILYERPANWFAYLDAKAKLGCPTSDEIERIAEVKACRDVLVHNRGVAGKTYASKAGRLARCQEGQRLDVSENYHRETWELLRKVVADISDAAMSKFS